MPLSNAQKQLIAEAFRDGNPIYVSFWSTAPNAAFSSGVEISNAGYARVLVTNDATNFDVSSEGLWSNKTVIRSANAEENWTPIVAIGLHTALSGGTPKYFHVLASPLTVYNGNPAEIPVGKLKIQF